MDSQRKMNLFIFSLCNREKNFIKRLMPLSNSIATEHPTNRH